jgi:hypothetical protein
MPVPVPCRKKVYILTAGTLKFKIFAITGTFCRVSSSFYFFKKRKRNIRKK